MFSKVLSAEAGEAFACHSAIALTDEHIWPRTRVDIERYCNEGSLFSARRVDTGQLVGLCYSILDERENAWEIGGLTVDESTRNKGIATALVRFVLAHTMVYAQPWDNGQRVVAHVHESNDKPRNVLQRVGFEQSRRITLPDQIAPPSMKRNTEGNVVGDELELRRDALIALSRWFSDEFDGTLGSGVRAEFRIEQGSLNDLRSALASMAENIRT